MLREAFLALSLAIFFQYFGEIFLGQLEVKQYSLQLTGGILLLLVAFYMIFPRVEEEQAKGQKSIPVFVPIATPLIAGPALLTMIMIFSSEDPSNLNITLAILLAWVGITIALVAAPMLQRFFGKRGLIALEQLMGLLLAMMAMEMIVQGSKVFIKSIS